MALNAATVWEIRPTGAQTNGSGFYNRVPGTSVDYSQQDSAQLTRSDIATDGAGTGLTSATGGFTAAMQGNVIYLTGGGATAGWYEIVTYISSNSVTIDRNAGANKTGVTGNVGGAFKLGGTLDNDFFAASQKVAGNIIWIKTGTYVLGESISTGVVGSTAAPFIVEGYKTTRGDAPVGNDRPTISMGSTFTFTSSNYYKYRNIIFTGSAADVFIGSTVICTNCSFYNTSTTVDRYAFRGPSASPLLVHCEIVSTNGYAVSFVAGGDSKCICCYIHDSKIGMRYGTAIGCVIDSCSTAGIQLGAITTSVSIYGNTIYNCGNGIDGGTSVLVNLINNIITNCTIGATWTSSTPWIYVDYNCWNNTTDVVNIVKGPNDITADPKLNDPANGIFALDGGSPCFDTGLQIGAAVGL